MSPGIGGNAGEPAGAAGPGRAGRTGLVRAGALVLAAATLLTGCSSLKKSIDRINASNAAYTELQNFIHDQLTTKFHRSVRSVSCTPRVDEVVVDSSVNFSCHVRFADGTSYTTQGTVNDPSTDPDVAYYTYSFYDPPGTDITTAPLPAPTVRLAASSPRSLFQASNLTPLMQQLTTRLSGHDIIVQLAIYPGELQAVVAGSGTAHPVSASYTGTVTVGPAASFAGSRSGIGLSQLVPSVIQRLTKLITHKGGVPLAHLGRFVLTNSLPHGDAGWNIYLTGGSTRFQSLVLGDHLVMITPGGTRALR